MPYLKNIAQFFSLLKYTFLHYFRDAEFQHMYGQEKFLKDALIKFLLYRYGHLVTIDQLALMHLQLDKLILDYASVIALS